MRCLASSPREFSDAALNTRYIGAVGGAYKCHMRPRFAEEVRGNAGYVPGANLTQALRLVRSIVGGAKQATYAFGLCQIDGRVCLKLQSV